MEASPSFANSRKRPRNGNDNSNNNRHRNNNNAGRGGRGRGRHGGGRMQGGRGGRGGSGDEKLSARSSGAPRNNGNEGATAVNSNRKSNSNQQNHRSHATASNNVTAKVQKTLPWANPHTHYIPLHEEERLLPTLLHWGKSERGMMKDQPPFRLQKIQKLLNGNHNRNKHSATASSSSSSGCMTLLQSLSLRRTHLKHLQPRLTMSQLKLGSEEDIRNSAAVFEQAVENYLARYDVLQCFWTEEDQRRETRKRGGKTPPTPDFRVKDGYCVQLDFDHGCNGIKCSIGLSRNKSVATTTTTTTTKIHWLEAKMFYGASTIPANTPNAVGAILPKMNEYVSLYGTGAIVFMYGCGDVLARQLFEIGVVALDGRGLDVSLVEESQRGWCANDNGVILF